MMPLLDKLLPSRKSFRKIESFVGSNVGAQEDDRDSVLQLGADQVRILLFRECEWRGRKLLFDSVTLEKQRSKNKTSPYDLRCNGDRKKEGPINLTRDFEGERTAEDDVSLLSEMVFGSVAMTYRGSSFKIHSMSSPPCIMCTKIFPVTEHARKPSERISDEGLGRSVNLDSNSSVRTLLSRPSSGNLSGTELCPAPRKSSTCSSTGSGWDIEIPPPTGSSHSLESNGSSGIGSLSSLRRRWFRVVSTSLGRSDSDDAFGMQHWGENGNDAREGHVKRHKTRLGLTMLVRLPEGHERKIEARLLEHMALMEGMLDRIRYSCIEASSIRNHYKGKEIPQSERLYRSSTRFVTSLLRLFLNVNPSTRSRTPLLWHDVLLNSVRIERRPNTLYQTLHQMCKLLDEIDTKSTNFFLSTVVTAVLTYHLGWTYTALPSHQRKLMEKLSNTSACNPLWAQLGDLYGALGNPVRVAHTVIAGDARKTELINSVLSFLSYFIRSGVVEKRREYRCTDQEDVKEAINVLEQARLKRPYLFNNAKVSSPVNDRNVSTSCRERRSSSLKQTSVRSGDNANVQRSCSQFSVNRSRTDRSVSPLKRSSTMKSNLDTYMLKPEVLEPDTKSLSKELPRNIDQTEKHIFSEDNDKNCASSKVKIIVSEIAPQEVDPSKLDPQDCPQLLLRNFEKKLDEDDIDESFAISKMDRRQRDADPYVDTLKLYTDRSYFNPAQSVASEHKDSQVFFTLGGEEKTSKPLPRPQAGYSCQCSYTFTGVPSTSAQLPEGVLRKIIQRNFPESSKSMQPRPGVASGIPSGSIGFCQKCNGQGYVTPANYNGSKQVLETPTNATEVLRTCGSSVGDGNVGLSRSNSWEALMEANGVIELPMPRSKKTDSSDVIKETGFTGTLLQSKMASEDTSANSSEIGYTWGLVLQGLIKKKKRRKRKVVNREEENDNHETEAEKEWWYCMREECLAGVRFPMIDQPVAESLCILADLDTWHVGILSNNTPSQTSPLPVGMSRLVANMLEAFVYVWRKYRSPSHCIGILEAKLKEMWLRSEALAEMLMAAELCDANVDNLTKALDLDAADIPLLLAVATSYFPEIAQRFGLTVT